MNLRNSFRLLLLLSGLILLRGTGCAGGTRSTSIDPATGRPRSPTIARPSSIVQPPPDPPPPQPRPAPQCGGPNSVGATCQVAPTGDPCVDPQTGICDSTGLCQYQPKNGPCNNGRGQCVGGRCQCTSNTDCGYDCTFSCPTGSKCQNGRSCVSIDTTGGGGGTTFACQSDSECPANNVCRGGACQLRSGPGCSRA